MLQKAFKVFKYVQFLYSHIMFYLYRYEYIRVLLAGKADTFSDSLIWTKLSNIIKHGNQA